MIRLLLAVALAVLASPSCLAQDRWIIDAGGIQAGAEIPAERRLSSMPLDDQITASITLKKDANGIESSKTGGACLVASIQPKACREQSECSPADLPRHIKGDRTAMWGYCLQQKCWTRPGPQSAYCKVGQTFAEGQPLMLPVVSVNTAEQGAPPSWRVHTCLNPVTPPDTKPACADPNNNDEKTYDGVPRRVR